MSDPDWEFFKPEFQPVPRGWDKRCVFAVVLSVVTLLYIGAQLWWFFS